VVTAKTAAALVPQELVADTLILPLAADPFVDTVIEFVLAPDVIVQPAGNDQVYDVALGTAAML
jgi:hypothetical protein